MIVWQIYKEIKNEYPEFEIPKHGCANDDPCCIIVAVYLTDLLGT
jgi:hypothetical protein